VFDESVDPAIQVTAAPEDVLDGIEPVLPGCDALVLASPMFQKDESPVGLEQPSNLRQSPKRIRDAAKRPGADHPVEPPIGKRQRFRGVVMDLDREIDGSCSPSHGARQKTSRVCGRQASDGGRVVSQVETRTEADFQHVSPNDGQE